MNRKEYMSRLSDALNEFQGEVKQEIMEDYTEHYEIGLQHGKSEEQISEELGDIEELVKELRKSENVTGKRNITSEPAASEYSVYVNAERPSHEEEKIPQYRSKRIVLRSKFAQVDVAASTDGGIHLDWVNYQESRAKEYYEFRTWEEGTTIYGEICRKSIGGIFVNVFGGEIRLQVRVPDGFPELEIQSMSGDTSLYGCNIESIRAGSFSGNVIAEKINADQLSFDSKSGDIHCRQMNSRSLNIDTKSGDIDLMNVQADSMLARTLSGDIKGRSVQGSTMFSSASGDVRIYMIRGNQIDASSISGDIELKEAEGEELKANSKSGDLRVEASAADSTVSTISGKIVLSNSREGRMKVNSISGNVNIRMYHVGGYEANVHTVSGRADLFYTDCCSRDHGNGRFTCGNGASKLEVRTTSGDIQIQA